MTEQSQAVLKTFIERARLLASSTYLTAVEAAKVNGLPPVFQGPDREQVEAFVLRLRFFIQDNEPTSLRNVAKMLERDASVPRQLVDQVAQVRTTLEKVFDSVPPIRATSKLDPNPPTWREIWDVFVYGELAHGDRGKRDRFERWKQSAPSFVLFSFQLGQIFSVMASAVTFLSGLFEDELRRSTAELPRNLPGEN